MRGGRLGGSSCGSGGEASRAAAAHSATAAAAACSKAAPSRHPAQIQEPSHCGTQGRATASSALLLTLLTFEPKK